MEVIVKNKEFKHLEKDPEFVKSVLSRMVYWSDDRLCHWFFDYEYKDHIWVSSDKINNELTKYELSVFKF